MIGDEPILFGLSDTAGVFFFYSFKIYFNLQFDVLCATICLITVNL